jgi:hypothetical protein
MREAWFNSALERTPAASRVGAPERQSRWADESEMFCCGDACVTSQQEHAR